MVRMAMGEEDLLHAGRIEAVCAQVTQDATGAAGDAGIHQRERATVFDYVDAPSQDAVHHMNARQDFHMRPHLDSGYAASADEETRRCTATSWACPVMA